MLLTDAPKSLRWIGHSILILIAWMQIVGSPCSAQESPSPESLAFFESKIRPVLVQHCYACHSEAAAENRKLQANLRLDLRAGWKTGGDSGPALVPHQPAESLLIQALRYDGIEMPPSGRLPDSVIADFEKWIADGAVDPRDGEATKTQPSIDWEAGRRLWSIQPLPESRSANESDPRSGAQTIDALVQQAQQVRGLTASPTADARTLIRRAWFDLLGLPPTPEDIAHWQHRLNGNGNTIDRAAWSELIDALLERPEYGERWARHWMDIARFAESYGYEQDYDRPNAYHYRDFLIRALNQDLPYDQFVQWQIAGDQLAPHEPLAWMATGFLVAGAFPTQLTETEFESTRYNELDDMTATTGVAFLGLSLGCARCHDHKFDPISVEDYYRFTAAFTKVIRCETTFDLDPAGNAQRRAAHDEEIARAKREREEWERNALEPAFQAWLDQPEVDRSASTAWVTLNGQIASEAKVQFAMQSDGSWLATGSPPAKDIVQFTSSPLALEFSSFRIEALSDPSLPNAGPGRAPNGNFALGDLKLQRITADGQAIAIPLHQPRATHQQNADSLSIAASIDSDPTSGWAVDGKIGRSQAAVFSTLEPIRLQPGERLQAVLRFHHPNPQHAIGRVRFSVHRGNDAAAEVGSDGPSLAILDALQRRRDGIANGSLHPRDWMDSPDGNLVRDWFKTTQAPWREATNRIARLEAEGPKIELTRVMVGSEGLPHLPHHADDRGYPHFYPDTHLLRRGDVAQKVRPVSTGTPTVFARTDAPSSVTSRAELARWMTDVEHGAGAIAARVMANRLWQHHFGRGIVSTPNDFGHSGQPPTHPELLDHLARRLVDSGWRLKAIHREIMASSTYMQSGKSAQDPRSKIDPENLYLWHRAPRRLEAEAIRDSMLAVSKTLDQRMFGPGSLDPNMTRRSIYFFIKRTQLIPSMMLFDWPEHLVSIGQRQSTTIAPQALMFMNHQPSRNMAVAFAKRIQSEDPYEAIVRAYWWAIGRAPTPAERDAAEALYMTSLADRRARNESDPELAATADVCQVLFALNEFIYID